MKLKSRFFLEILHVAVLFNFAVAQPLYDLLSRNSVFFVVQKAQALDIFLVAAALSFLLPILLMFLLLPVRLLGIRIWRWTMGLVMALLVGFIFMPVLKKMGIFSGLNSLRVATLIGVCFSFAYTRLRIMRIFLNYLSPVILILPSLFLFHPQISKLLFKSDYEKVGYNFKTKTPIVMLVFDEFPLISLMNQNHEIDGVRYPHFSALASESYWFRNTTTVGESTEHAVPAILTGQYPKRGDIPTVSDHPHNLFTWLLKSYDFGVFETLTQLCPPELSGNPLSHQSLRMRQRNLWSNILLVYRLVILPKEYNKGLPDISKSWDKFFGIASGFNFGRKARAAHQMSEHVFKLFLDDISDSRKPRLNFLHVMLPHYPWEYLPSGKTYPKGERMRPFLDRKWIDDENLVLLEYQRHLLQVAYVDSLLGQIMDKMKAVGVYDKAIFIVVADHGVCFRPREFRRLISKANFQDILPIPLFIKIPGQKEGILSDRNVETVDILPTIADILDVTISWAVDGYSAMDLSHPERQEKNFIVHATGEKLIFDSQLKEKYDALSRQISFFGAGTPIDQLARKGRHDALLRKSLKDVVIDDDSELTVRVDQKSFFDNVDLELSFVPALVTGYIERHKSVDQLSEVAIAINGRIEAFSPLSKGRKGRKDFAALIPEAALHNGQNEIRVFWIEDQNNNVVFHPMKFKSTSASYVLAIVDSGKGKRILSSEGKTFDVVPRAITGYLDRAILKNQKVEFNGWAANIEKLEVAEDIIIFSDEKSVFSDSVNMERPDVAKVYGNAALSSVGFSYELPLSMFKNFNESKIRVFAISKDGFASELIYPKGYYWHKHQRTAKD